MANFQSLTLAEQKRWRELNEKYMGRWTYPCMGMTFQQAVRGMRFAERQRFGTGVTAGSGAEREIVIGDYNSLLGYYNPLEGEFDPAGNYIDGTGASTINSEPQKYSPTFGPDTHLFQSDGLKLKTKVYNGEFKIVKRGQIAAPGLNVNHVNTSPPVVTPVAAVSLTSADLADLKIGQVINNTNLGWAFISAIDTTNSTITFTAITGGARANVTSGNWHIDFTNFFYALLAPGTQVGRLVTDTIQLRDPLPASVVVGQTILTARCFNTSTQSYRPLEHASSCRIKTISADRKTVVFDKVLDPLNTLFGSNNDGVFFLPSLFAGQMWSRRHYGPQLTNRRAQAIRVEFTMPAMPQPTAIQAPFTKANVDAYLAANPGMLYGYWPAVWLYNNRPLLDADDLMIGQNTIAGAPNRWTEIDLLELFRRIGNEGPSGWTGNLHRYPHTRIRNMELENVFAELSAIRPPYPPNSVWRTSAATSVNQTPDSKVLFTGAPIADGTRRSVAVTYDGRFCTHYLDDFAICESTYPISTIYPHQLGMNVACGSLADGEGYNGFYPLDNAMAEAMHLTIHSVEAYQY